jgi:hypothetical protein
MHTPPSRVQGLGYSWRSATILPLRELVSLPSLGGYLWRGGVSPSSYFALFWAAVAWAVVFLSLQVCRARAHRRLTVRIRAVWAA